MKVTSHVVQLTKRKIVGRMGTCVLAVLALPGSTGWTLETPAPIRVSTDGHFLMQADGHPFFWLSDAAWSLATRSKRDEAEVYLKDRAAKGFTVMAVEVMAYAAADGTWNRSGNAANAYGAQPFVDGDFGRPNELYFQYIDWVIDRAEYYGLRVALVPVWGLWTVTNGKMTVAQAETYGRWLGARYKGKAVIWMLGGDLTPLWRSSSSTVEPPGTTLVDYRPHFDAMARGIAAGETGHPLITYHIACCNWPGTASARTSLYFSDRPWLTINYVQLTSFRDLATIRKATGFAQSWISGYEYEPIAEEYRSLPPRPVISADPKAEDIPFDADLLPPEQVNYGDRVTAKDVRFYAYESVFSGAAGAGYNHNSLTGFFDPTRAKPVTGERSSWRDALDAPGAGQMSFVKALMLSRPYFTRIPDQSVVRGDAGEGIAHIAATRDRSGSYIMIYLPAGQSVNVEMAKLAGSFAKGWWYDTRTGKAISIPETIPTNQDHRFVPPVTDTAVDWVLVVDDATRNFPSPGSHLTEIK